MLKIAFTSTSERACSVLKDRYWNVFTTLSDGWGEQIYPVFLPSYDGIGYLDTCAVEYDGYVFTGGTDIDPVFYGKTNEAGTARDVHPLRDRFELGLARRLMRREQPVLGICRGLQVLCVAAGGVLRQDIGDSGETNAHQRINADGIPYHELALYGCLREIAGKSRVLTNSYHHQAPEKPGMGMEICALHRDGCIEGLALREHPFFLGVQWHPEICPDTFSKQLFMHFLSVCATQKSKKA